LSVVASIAIILLLVVSLAYYGMEKSVSQSTQSTASGSSESSSAPSATSEETSSQSGSATTSGQAGSSASETVHTPEEATGLLDCTAQEKAFLNEGATYSRLGYPEIAGDGDNPINAQSPAYVYFVQFPNEFEDVSLGTVGVPMIGACQALGEAISLLGIDSSNYALARVVINDGEVNTANYVSDPSWYFYFAQIYQGYWLDAKTATGFSASAAVDAVTGHAEPSMGNLALPSAPQNLTVNVNSTEALQLVRHAAMNEGPAIVANGTLGSMDLRIATMYTVEGGAYATIQPVNASTPAGQLRLLWIITTNAPDYVGYFVVDAETGQVVEAEGESTQPCGGSPNCGIAYSTPSGVISTPMYDQTRGLQVASESFEVNGSALGINGTYSVEVPHVVVMRPGSSGSIGLNLTGIEETCPPPSGNIIYDCPSSYQVAPRASTPPNDTLPYGVSVSFSDPSVSVPVGGSVNDTLLISVPSNATQGTSIIFLQNPPSTDYAGYIVLSVWNGQGQWPVLPMLNAPLLDGQEQPVIVNGTSIFATGPPAPVVASANVGTIPIQESGAALTAVAVDQSRNLVFAEVGLGSGEVVVQVISAANQTVVNTITLYHAFNPEGLAFNPASDMLYAVTLCSDVPPSYSLCSGPGELYAVSLKSMTIVANVTQAAPWGVAFDPVTNMIYVINGNGNGGGDVAGHSLSVVDASTYGVVANVHVDGTDWGGAVAVDPVTNMIYVTEEATPGVTVVDGSNNSVIATVAVPGSTPTGIAVDPDTNTVYVANYDSHSVSVIDGAENYVTATILVGKHPFGVAVDPGTDAIFVSDSSASGVAVINGATNQVVETVPTYSSPTGLAVDSATGLVYVAGASAISVILDSTLYASTSTTAATSTHT